jgi:nickel-type superoxide dismutase maturation protease
MRDKKDMADFLLGEGGGRRGAYPAPAGGNHPNGGAFVLAALAGAVAGVAVLARCFRRLEVEGDSMRPTLLAGDRVLVWRCARARPGDVVALDEPPGYTVKRVASAGAGGGVIVLGDNSSASTDSRHFGPVDPRAILGRVVWRYWPEDRRGRLPLSGTRSHGV